MDKKDIAEKLIEKATQDATFRTRLISDTKAAINDVTGVSVPDQIKITILEENPTQYYLVLPSQFLEEDELSEKDLDSVAGGNDLMGTWTHTPCT